MSTNLEKRIELQLKEAENEAKRLENEAKRLENEAKKLEIEAKRENTILRLTINEWIDAVDAGGGCAWTLAVLILLAVVVLNPEEAETLDQYIVGFGGLAIGYYLRDKNSK